MSYYRIIGIESSPYAVKVRAVMRYRHLPYIWVARMPQYFAETANVRPLIMPVVQYPDGEYRTDSTPIVLDLEQRHPSARSIVPDTPGLAFLSALIEDMADEWLTKCLFHYRFSSPRDRTFGAAWVMDDTHPEMSPARLATLVEDFVARQVARMPLVGCTPDNAPLIERFYRELLAILEGFLSTDRFIFGSRPALADFGIYGQLKTLGTDPTGLDIMREYAPRTERWVRRLDDASGVTGQWCSGVDAIDSHHEALLGLAGRYYLPFLHANALAIDAGESTVELTLAEQPYAQPVYRYQAKCRAYLVNRFAALSPHDADTITPLLERTGCLKYLRTI